MSRAPGDRAPDAAGSGLRTAPLGREHNRELVELFRASPIIADFTVCFDRHPDFFRFPELVFEEFEYRGIFAGDRLIGSMMAAFLDGWLGDRVGRYAYMGDLRIVPDMRGQRITERLGWDFFDEQLDKVPIAIGLIKDGNLPITHITMDKAPPVYQTGRLCPFEASNLILLRPAPAPRSTRVRRATAADLPAMVDVMAEAYRGRLFAPVVTREGLAAEISDPGRPPISDYFLAEREGRLVGLFAAWDMGRFKRTLVLRYSPMGRALKRGYQLGRLLFRRAAPLPDAGQPFREVTITRIAVPDRDPEILADLLAVAANDYLDRGYHMMHVGFAGWDPLIEATDRFMVQRFKSTLVIGWRTDRGAAELDGATDIYVDLSII